MMTNPSDTGDENPHRLRKLSSKPLILTSPKQQKGAFFERLACAYLQQQGLDLIAQNWQQPKVGEIDLIMMETGQAWPILVFIEVRLRKPSGFGDAALSVTLAKQRKLVKTAQYFLQKHPRYADCECRFDIIVYDGDYDRHQPPICPTKWLKGAFMAAAW